MPRPIALSRAQVREVDRRAIEELGIPGVVLMENAGRNATDLIQRAFTDARHELSAALILCGGGNNGGDGYVIARHLHNRGIAARILATKPVDELTGDAAIHARICRAMRLDIQPASPQTLTDAIADGPELIIDALLGTGFRGELRTDLLELIRAVNAIHDRADPPMVAAIDLPSGLDCDTGRPARDAVRADLTVTFVAPKLGFSQPAAWPYLGTLEVADIGAPPGLTAKIL